MIMAFCHHPNHLLKTTVNMIDSMLEMHELMDDKQVQRLQHYSSEAKSVAKLTSLDGIKVPIVATSSDSKLALYKFKVYKNDYINKAVANLLNQVRVQGGGANRLANMAYAAGSKAYQLGLNMIYYTIMTMWCFPSIAYKTVMATSTGQAQLYIMENLVSQKRVLPMGDLILYTLVTGLTKSDQLDLFYPDHKKRYAAYQGVVLESKAIKRDKESAEMVHSVFKFLLYLVMYTTTSQGEGLKKRMQTFMTSMYGSASGKRLESIITMGDIFDVKADLDKQNNKLCKVAQDEMDLDKARDFFATVMSSFEDLERSNLVNTTNVYYMASKKVVETATKIFATKYNQKVVLELPKTVVVNNQTVCDVLVSEGAVTPLGDEVLFAIVTGVTGDDGLKLFYGDDHEKRKADYARVLNGKGGKSLPVELAVAVGLLINNADIHSHCNHDLENVMINLFGERKPSVPLNIMQVYRMIRSGNDTPRVPSDFRAIYYRILNMAETLEKEKMLEQTNPLLNQTFVALETAFTIFEKKHGLKSVIPKSVAVPIKRDAPVLIVKPKVEESAKKADVKPTTLITKPKESSSILKLIKKKE